MTPQVNIFSDATEEKTQQSFALSVKGKHAYQLVVHNDDYNTFDYVIEILIKVCHHTHEQAHQCTLLTHFKGKCEVKTGSMKELKPMKTSILDAGIQATIS